ncbi:MAG TPA: peptidoglycan DD-metalloendopeptidase family protein [Armatimonadota bacterium]|nr:peptidoglycan DD-metalloendopeptidase family protein [Armatimonadota bacterium]
MGNAKRSRLVRQMALTLAAVAMVPVVYAAGASGLRARRDSIFSQMRAVRAQRADAASEAERCRQELRASEERLAAADRSYKRAVAEKRKAQEGIQQAAEARDRAMAELAEAQSLLESRLVAMFKAGSGSYTEVVLGAQDLTDMTTRAYLCERIVEGDLELIRHMTARKQAAELEEQRLVVEESRLRKAEAALAEAKRKRAAEAEHQRALLEEQKQIVAEIDQELAELAAASAQIEQELRALAAQRGNLQPSQAWTGSWRAPVSGRITSGYGMRIHPISRRLANHTGVDISAPTGTDVAAAGSGVVCKAAYGYNGGYGNMVVVNHGNGRATLYAHLSSISVRVGQTVTAGQKLGEVGSTGRSTGPHLHFEVRINGRPTNPMM